ncbi:phage protein [Spirochaetia bacterium]|nr:phage protein [Spirochaetia bacterium]
MRKIIFCGKREDTGEWVYGKLCPHDRIASTYSTYNGEPIYEQKYVIPETVGQYTGFKDRNDKMIFEGWIVDVFDSNLEKIGRGKITFLDDWGLWYVDSVPSFQEDLDHGKCNQANNGLGDILYENSVEIIGNIHDNPELLIEKDPV